MNELTTAVHLTQEEIERVLDWTEGDRSAPDCGDDLCVVCSARTKLREAQEADQCPE